MTFQATSSRRLRQLPDPYNSKQLFVFIDTKSFELKLCSKINYVRKINIENIGEMLFLLPKERLVNDDYFSWNFRKEV